MPKRARSDGGGGGGGGKKARGASGSGRHSPPASLATLHFEVTDGSYDDGQSFWAKGPKGGSANTCNYNWQCHHRMSTTDRHLYDWPAYRSYQRVWARDDKQWFKRGLGAPVELQVSHLPGAPSEQNNSVLPGSWDVAVPGNFKSVSVPYWHNDHHIIPFSVMRDAIKQVETQVGLTNDEIAACLLEAAYNLNHHRNMIMLPQDPRVAQALRLPRHLTLGPQPYRPTPAEWFDHAAYSKNVLEKLKAVLESFFPGPLEECEIDPAVAEGCVEAIGQLQDELHATIKTAVRGLTQLSLEQIPRSSFGLP